MRFQPCCRDSSVMWQSCQSQPRGVYMTRPAYLGPHHAGFELGDPAAPGYRPPQFALATGTGGSRLHDRVSLVGQLDGLRQEADATPDWVRRTASGNWPSTC